ncbi:unnamed protein product [Spirodela intermedia]|uniref:Syntaxin 6/10/61 N-terminal domain-containing protein n=1 Tax=Spirodela intermedia TaxID=51605 RepID=A0A7I8IKI0_SPIIN|nr:unnamed protein product [Spirodela intermedia]CAA6657497.1 unnamed protein product [Spirodela intermedia]
MTSTSTFDRWEKDPFFAVAEEVQESADRMESIYRRWMHEKKGHPKLEGEEEASGEPELRRELHAALGTAKWQRLRTGDLKCEVILYQLEEFDRASRSNGPANETDDDSRKRHSQFVAAIGNQILAVEGALKDLEIGADARHWFGSMYSIERGEKIPPLAPGSGNGRSETKGINREVRIDLPKSSVVSNEPGAKDAREERKHGHRRAASVGADLGTWKSSISNEDSPRRSLNERPDMPPPKVLSFSGLSMAAESTWRINCLSDCGDESYDKQIYGCIGTFQRQLQRSQYQIQYGRPIQVIFWVALAFLLIRHLIFIWTCRHYKNSTTLHIPWTHSRESLCRPEWLVWGKVQLGLK